ncbi:MAG TPA: hypothetical protein PKC03_15880 [Dokdonella sp.]|nr:hypothetical protein [Dokdonella sp.]
MDWKLFAAPAALALVALGLVAKRRRTAIRSDHERCARQLQAGGGDRIVAVGIDGLPAPVRRYFRHVLPGDRQLPAVTCLSQHGRLRTSCTSSRWLEFDAEQVIAARSRGFQWLARIGIGAGLTLEVCDRLVDGEASSELRLCSLVRLGADRGNRQIHEAALQRFLAEAVWSPAALLPEAGVTWTAIDDASALATLACGETRVSLEFRFNAQDEVASVFTPARWMREKGGYRAVAWKGHYFDYAVRDGIRVPLRAEAGWYPGADWCPVWSGRVARVAQLPLRPDRTSNRAISSARG